MSASFRAGIHKLAIALAHLWFTHGDGDWFEAFVYSKDLDTNSPRLARRRIKVRIEIEDDPRPDVDRVVVGLPMATLDAFKARPAKGENK